MKILIVMGGFFPGKKYGGPPVSVDNFCSLMKEHECFIVTHDHDMFEKERYQYIKENWNDRENCKVLYVSDSEYVKSLFESVINEIKPDLIYLQGFFQSCVLPCLQLAKKYGVSVLLAPRGELCKGALNIKKWKKIPYIAVLKKMGFLKNIHWQSTSDEETEAIKRLMEVDARHVHRLDNIPSIPKKEYSREKKNAGEGRFIFLSRIHPKKNLLFAIPLFNGIDGKAQLDIYGPIEDEEYWRQCQAEIKKLSDNVKVRHLGLIGHEEVHEVFSQYDAFILPTLSENYGHVIAESLMVGTPVIISNQTPWRNLESAGVGWDIDLMNKEGFRKAIQMIVDMDEEQMSRTRIITEAFAREHSNINELKTKYSKALIGACSDE